ncbi:MAG: (2Fe-2S)-binding protein [Wenzhouxiangella sp.]|nr:MAG: (2Fe-2S)-binding protein [Wenzhouxiangella sp.]
MITMFICVCNALPEETVRTLAREGMSFEEIQAVTGCSSCCGSCREFAEAVIEQSRHLPGSRSSTLPVLSMA